MASGQVHVVPSELGHWMVLDGHRRPHSMHPTQTDAERAALEYAAQCKASDVVLHDRYKRVHQVRHEHRRPPRRSVLPTAAPSYHALRISRDASVEWCEHALKRRGSAPAAILALLGGRTRVELTAEEAADAIEWATRVQGWNDDGPPPLIVHAPRGDPSGPCQPLARAA